MIGKTNVSSGAGGEFAKDLLWQNASPTSEFASQSISVSVDNYKWILVEWRYSTEYANHQTMICRIGADNLLSINGQSNNRTGGRVVKARYTQTDRPGHTINSYISFGGAKYNEKENDIYVIPTHIWGIKGATV